MKEIKSISVLGLGYVGTTTLAGFSMLGYHMIGVDLIKDKVDIINKGESFIKNDNLEVAIKKGRYKSNIYATQNLEYAVANSDLSFICVETPTKKGELDLNPLKKISKDLGTLLKEKEDHIVVVRSTIFPDSFNILKGIMTKYAGKELSVALNPEFLREKTCMEDFINPCYIVVGSENKELGNKVMDLYKGIDAKKFIVDEKIAQMIKYANNSFHALKVAYTNELSEISRKAGIDENKLMELVKADTKLNISPLYFQPGKAYDGHCLPKDLVVLQTEGKKLGISSPIIDAISKSNDLQIRRDKK